jgi:membrane dipeptidase
MPARAIHQRILAIDSHVDVLLPGTPEQYFLPGHASRADLDKLGRGGIGAVAFAIAVGPGPRTAEGVTEARKEADAKLAAIRTFVKEHPDRVELALSADDIVRIHKAGKLAIIESFLNARSIGKDLSAIDAFYRNGVRLFGFDHAGNNDFADSSRPSGEPAEEHHGLSPLGKQAVARLNRLGVIVDVSQLTPAGVLQTLELSKAPVIASHSNVRALVDNARCLSDRELDAIKANGGVVDVTAFNAYLKPLPQDFNAQLNAVRQQFGLAQTSKTGTAGIEDAATGLPRDRSAAYLERARALVPRANVTDYVNHIDYIVKRIGVDHVGIGTDFNHGAGIDGFDDESQAPSVTRELVRRGYTEEQIAKIWGGNFLRVFREVESVSRRLQAS